MATHARRFTLPVLLLGVTLGAPALAAAQNDTTVVTQTRQTEKEDHDFPWGLLGLFGLAGLIPRRRKDVHVHEEIHTRPVTPRDPPPPPRP
jgi:MYXO-CTERM domain-containing protein